jgi:hypothetical protein
MIKGEDEDLRPAMTYINKIEKDAEIVHIYGKILI